MGRQSFFPQGNGVVCPSGAGYKKDFDIVRVFLSCARRQASGSQDASSNMIPSRKQRFDKTIFLENNM